MKGCKYRNNRLNVGASLKRRGGSKTSRLQNSEELEIVGKKLKEGVKERRK